MKKYVIAMLCLIVLFVGTVFALPSARIYDVQVIVFSHITQKTLDSEHWPILTDADVNAFTENTAPTKPALGLQREENALRSNPAFKILLSGSWRETWHDKRSTITIPLFNNSDLRGLLTIELGHFFNIRANLLLTQPINALQKIATNGYFNTLAQPDFYFQMTQNRRMRSNELNYLSSPLMGVLIKIDKIS